MEDNQRIKIPESDGQKHLRQQSLGLLTAMGKRGITIFAGAPDALSVERRRAKNKIASKQRKINRKRGH